MDLTGESSKAQLRRVNKPLLEKRRRARINACLNQLKNIVLETLRKDTARYSKLEKADILEMTVDYLKSIRNKQQPRGVQENNERLPDVGSNSTPVNLNCSQQELNYNGELHAAHADYGAGYRDCAAEIRRYFDLCQQLQKQHYLNFDEMKTSPDVDEHLQRHLERILAATTSPDDQTAISDENNNETPKCLTASMTNNFRLPDRHFRQHTASSTSTSSGSSSQLSAGLSSRKYHKYELLDVNAAALPVGEDFVGDSCRSLLSQSSPSGMAAMAASATGNDSVVGLFSYELMQVAAAAAKASVASTFVDEEENFADRLADQISHKAPDSIRHRANYSRATDFDINDCTAASSKWPAFDCSRISSASPSLSINDRCEVPLPPVSWNSVSSTSSDAESSAVLPPHAVWRPW